MSEKTEPAKNSTQRRVLFTALVLNLGLAAALAVAGLYADSSSLIANALDNASDGVVYALSLAAVGASGSSKRVAATVSGVLLIVLAVGILGDTARRYIYGSEPVGPVMMGLAVIAAAINLICLKLLQRLRSDDTNIKAARTFSFNDFVSNGGVLVAGVLVAVTGARWPDLAVGALVAAISLKGGIEILRDAQQPRSID